MSLRTWKRLLIGSAPFGFTLEVFLRTVLVYLFLMAAVRLLGKRMSGQVTNLELGVMLTLGAIVSVPIQSADRGIVPGIVLLICIVLLQRGFSELGSRSFRAEALLVGRASMLARDGVLLPRELERARVSQQQLFSTLRSQHIRHLGEIERIYFEAGGAFSVLRREEPLPGLSVLPPTSSSVMHQHPREALLCSYCGAAAPAEGEADTQCSNCSHREWVEPVDPGAGGAHK